MRKFTLEQVKDGLCRRFEAMFMWYQPGCMEVMSENGRPALVLKTKKSVATAVYYPADQRLRFYQKTNKNLRPLELSEDGCLEFRGKDVLVSVGKLWNNETRRSATEITVQWLENDPLRAEKCSPERLDEFFSGFCSASEDDAVFNALWKPDFAVKCCRRFGMPGYVLELYKEKRARHILFLSALDDYYFAPDKSVEDKYSLKIFRDPAVMYYGDQSFASNGQLIFAKTHQYFTEYEARQIAKCYPEDTENLSLYPQYIAIYYRGKPYWLLGCKGDYTYFAIDAVYGTPTLIFDKEVVIALPRDDNFYPII